MPELDALGIYFKGLLEEITAEVYRDPQAKWNCEESYSYSGMMHVQSRSGIYLPYGVVVSFSSKIDGAYDFAIVDANGNTGKYRSGTIPIDDHARAKELLSRAMRRRFDKWKTQRLVW
jgi:hypothetical protein